MVLKKGLKELRVYDTYMYYKSRKFSIYAVYDAQNTTYNSGMKKEVADLRRNVGLQIRGIRKARGLTQEELAEKADLSYKYIGELERGQVNVSLDSLQRIADALEREIGEFFPQSESPLSKLSPQDLQQIKHTLKLLNKVFAKT